MFCTKCGAELAEAGKFCPNCGSRITTRPNCSQCGTQLPEGSKFCPNCGVRVAAAKPSGTRSPARDIEMPEALAIVGALAMLVGPFLLWIKTPAMSLQGLDWSTGPALFVLGALCFGALILVRNGDYLSGLAYIGLGFVGLALIFHFVYVFFDMFDLSWETIGAGFYVTGMGSFLVLAGGVARLLSRAPQPWGRRPTQPSARARENHAQPSTHTRKPRSGS